MLAFTPARLVLGAAAALALAAPAALLLAGRADSVRVLACCALAGLLALLGPALGRRSWGRPAVTVALAAVVAISPADPWGLTPLVFAAGAVGLAILGLILGRFQRRGMIAAAVSLCVAAVGLGVAWHQADTDDLHPGVHTWNQYHYVLGTKYYAELGNHDLYLATLLADADGDNHLEGLQKVRNMHTYKPLRRQQALDLAAARGVRARFTDARWAELKEDWRAFYPLLAPKHWPGVFTDLGFNASPVWVVLYQPLVNAIDIDRGSLQALAALQLPMYLAVVAAALWGFGLRATLWLGLWTLLFFGNRGRLYGGFFSYDWFALVVIATALIARGRALAAPLVAIGGLMRGFGGLLAIGPTLHWLRGLWRDRRPPPWDTRFLAILALSMALLGAASLGSGRGVEGWIGWKEKIELHSMRISTGGRHLGLKVLFGEDWSEPGHTADLGRRREIYARQATAYHGVQALLIGWTLLILPRRSRLDAALLGLIPAFALMVLSRYYYAAWGVLLLLGTRPEDRDGKPIVQLALLAVIALHDGLRHVDGSTPDSRHQAVNLLILLLSIAALSTYTVVDWRARSRPQGGPPQ